MIAKRKRRWLQFSLRTLLALVTALAVLLGVRDRALRQGRAAAAIRKLGGEVVTESSAPTWLRKLLGEDCFVRVVEVRFRARITDADLQHLGALPDLRTLDLWGTRVRGEGLEHLKHLANLENLYLWNTSLGDPGLAHVEGLTNLRSLDLWGTQVSDAGLKHLKGLSKLQTLYLWETQVTDSGVADLQRAVPNVVIYRGANTHRDREH